MCVKETDAINPYAMKVYLNLGIALPRSCVLKCLYIKWFFNTMIFYKCQIVFRLQSTRVTRNVNAASVLFQSRRFETKFQSTNWVNCDSDNRKESTRVKTYARKRILWNQGKTIHADLVNAVHSLKNQGHPRKCSLIRITLAKFGHDNNPFVF